MPTPKTEATELSVAFGLLGIIDPHSHFQHIDSLFNGSVTPNVYKNYIIEYQRNIVLYHKFIELGLQLREAEFSGINQVLWTGPQQLAATVPSAKDLFIEERNTFISIKNDSNVVANLSPTNLIINLPKGLVVTSRSTDWFIEKDYPGLQRLYLHVRNIINESFPIDIHDFYANHPKSDRKKLQSFIKKGMSSTDKHLFDDKYREMCIKVAKESAAEFNQNLFTLDKNRRPAVFENLVKQFFRLNSTPYLLTGLDKGRSFAVRIPDITNWKHEWEVLSFVAEPLLNSGQSMVKILFQFTNKSNKNRFELPFHVEIRWSHGKFCGNPEGKLYKEFNWMDVPFFSGLI